MTNHLAPPPSERRAAPSPDQVAAAVEVLAHAGDPDILADLPTDQLQARFDAFRRLEGIATAGQARTTHLLARTGAVRATGAPTTTAWLQQAGNRSTRDAARMARLARNLDQLPATAEAIAQGAITKDAADIVVRAATDGRLGTTDHIDTTLADLARHTTPERLAREVRRRTHRIDGAAMLRDEDRQHAARRLTLTDTGDGTSHLHAHLPGEMAERLRTCLDALDRPDPPDTPDHQRRTHPQRMADALDAGVTQLLARGGRLRGTGGRVPQLTVTVDLATITSDLAASAPSTAHSTPATVTPDSRGSTGTDATGPDDTGTDANGTDANGTDEGCGLCDDPDLPRPVAVDDPVWADLPTGTTEWGRQLSPQAVRRILCDAGITRTVTHGTSLPIDLGRTTRSWTPAQRKAITARDHGCRGPTCDRPPGWTQVHHITWWRDDGPTDLANGILLCHACHRLVHDHGWTLRLDHTTGAAHWTAPDGTHHLAPPRTT